MQIALNILLRTPLLLSVVWLAIFCGGTIKGGTQEMINVGLKIVQYSERVVAEVNITNSSVQTIEISQHLTANDMNKQFIKGQELIADVFDIRDQRDIRAKYKGAKAKIPAKLLKNIKIEENESLLFTVDLEKYYLIEPGITYLFQYNGLVFGEISGEVTPIKSEKILVHLNKYGGPVPSK